jgi:hypothetical protein
VCVSTSSPSIPRQGRGLAVELKYLTAAWQGTVAGEHFTLLNQGAQDIRGYDCVRDICRLEQIVNATENLHGLAIVLTNEPSYWHAPSHCRPTNASQFRLHEGTVLRAGAPGGRTMGMRQPVSEPRFVGNGSRADSVDHHVVRLKPRVGLGRLHQPTRRIDDRATTHTCQANGTRRPAVMVGGLEVDRDEVEHPEILAHAAADAHGLLDGIVWIAHSRSTLRASSQTSKGPS